MGLAYQVQIEEVFEEKKHHLDSKTGQKGYDFTYHKGPQQMQNFLHDKKVKFLVRLYHYILLTTSVW